MYFKRKIQIKHRKFPNAAKSPALSRARKWEIVEFYNNIGKIYVYHISTDFFHYFPLVIYNDVLMSI